MKRKTWTMRAGGLILLVLMMLMGSRLHLQSFGRHVWAPRAPAVPNSTLRQIKCRPTPPNTGRWGSWASRAGPPAPPANTEVLTYEYTKTVDSNFSFFIFFDGDSRREERTNPLFRARKRKS